MEKTAKIYLVSLILVLIIGLSSFVILNNLLTTGSNVTVDATTEQINTNKNSFSLQFNGTRAFSYLKDQVDIGFRPPNSTGIEKTRDLIINQLQRFNWTIELNNFTYMGVKSVNILAFPGNSNRENITLFGAHYDTRWWADRDPNAANQHKPVLGANDGASGVAVLMEFSQTFANRTDIGLLFIDAEDQGDIAGWIYSAGTYEFVNNTILQQYFPHGKSDIRVFILLDMIGDWQLNIKKEYNSNIAFKNQIWSSAASLNFTSSFTNYPGYSMIDDHIPFIEAGIPAVDLIDFDYTDANGMNLHHTTRDVLQYVSADSLWIVGQTLEYWINTTTNQ